MKADGAVKQRQHRVKTGLLLQRTCIHRAGQCLRQEVQALNMAANGQQAPAVVTRHAVGLRAGECGHQLAGAHQHALRLHRVVAVGHVGMQQGVLRLLDQAPVLGREPLAHARGGQKHGFQVKAHTRGVLRVPQTCHQRTLKHPARLLGCGHARHHQAMNHGELVEPGDQRRAGLVFAAQHVERQAGEAQDVFAALGVAAHPKQVFCRAAGHDALAQRACSQGGRERRRALPGPQRYGAIRRERAGGLALALNLA